MELTLLLFKGTCLPYLSLSLQFTGSFCAAFVSKILVTLLSCLLVNLIAPGHTTQLCEVQPHLSLLQQKKAEVNERKEFNREEDLKISHIDAKASKALISKAALLRTKFAPGESKFL